MPHPDGDIFVVVDKPYYLGGEMVTGRVDIVVRRMIPSARSACLQWKGFERALIQNTIQRQNPAGGPPIREKKSYLDEKTFFKQQLVLFSFGGAGLAPGNHTFPFQYQLPVDLPGVFYDERRELDGDWIKGAIVYKVKAWLDMPGKDIKTHQKIVVSEAVTKQIHPLHEENRKSFLFAKGELSMKVDIQKNVFIPGEPIPVAVHVSNTSSKKVEHLKVKLMREVTVRAQGHEKKHVAEVHRKVFPGVDKHETKDQVLLFELAPNIFPSTEGRLVQCRYHLDVECDVAMAIDLEVHPKVTVALLPAMGVPVLIYQNYPSRGWQG
eukprot:TRINITY_DN6210_c0_g1_i1.p1 TRINITY_DN6210_c0_g1~~TRINITY_DN6210_c0_g1_i1.p1  ORF type:complete len:368 (+),score=77.97 TRINITY_DN6210_c0_g1_i1:137-1105(+)